MKRALVIHHSADMDGKFSGAICKYFLERQGYDVHMLGWDYGDPAPTEADAASDFEVIYLVDISMDYLLADRLHQGEIDQRIIWIDHHKTAIEKYSEKHLGYRVDGVAACRLCWQWFAHMEEYREQGCGMPDKAAYTNRIVEEPEGIRLIGEYDVWDKRDKRANLLNIALYTVDVESTLCAFIQGDSRILDTLVDRGDTINQWQCKMNGSIVKANAHLVHFHELDFLCLNTARGNSLTFQTDRKDFDALMMWRFDGRKCTVSLYHAPHNTGIDLSTIAKHFNGGGHRGACGFQVSLDIMYDILTDAHAHPIAISL